MKKLESLGRILSKEEQKKIIGGDEEVGGGSTVCSNGGPCSYYESGTGMVNGTCVVNSNEQCVCKAANSSVVWAGCIAT